MAKPSAFDKDFGYLAPFLDKVASAARELPDPAAREELTRLMAEEKGRWSRIRALLGGSAPAAASAASHPPASPRLSAESHAAVPRSLGLTVGSLRPKS